MEKPSLLLLFVCLVPLFTALVATIIEAISLQDSITIREKRIKRMLMYYFLSFIGIASGISTGMAVPKVAVHLWPLTVLALNIAPVLYYRSALILADTVNKEKRLFSFHFLFPILSGIFCLLLNHHLPDDVSLRLLRGKQVEGYAIATAVYRSVPIIQLILSIICTTITVRLLTACYRKNKKQQPDLWKNWLRLSYILALLATVWSVSLFFTVWPQTGAWALPIAASAAWIQAMYLCCFTFNRHSLLFLPLTIAPIPLRVPSAEQLSTHGTGGHYRKYIRWNKTGDPVAVEAAPLNRKRFEQHVIGKKMYLNPQLRLTDLMKVFNTNRSYLSRFINETYGHGFNGYINRLRLKELERLMRLPSNQGKTITKLYPKAGFPNYQVYLRINREVRSQEAARNSGNPTNPTQP